MATAILSLAQIIVARLEAAPAVDATVRRQHRVPLPREEAPAIDVIVQRGQRTGTARSCVQWQIRVLVRLIVRNDDTLETLEPLLLATLERIDPATPGFTAYGPNVSLDLVGFDVDEEVADRDLVVLELEYAARFVAEDNRLEVL